MLSDCSIPPDNGAVFNIMQLIKVVVTSAAEAEIGAPYTNAREAVPAQIYPTGNGPPTAVYTNANIQNTTAPGVVTSNIQL